MNTTIITDKNEGTFLIIFPEDFNTSDFCWGKLENWLIEHDFYDHVMQFWPIKNYITIGIYSSMFDEFSEKLNKFIEEI